MTISRESPKIRKKWTHFERKKNGEWNEMAEFKRVLKIVSFALWVWNKKTESDLHDSIILYLSLHSNSHNCSTKFKNTLYIYNRRRQLLQAEMDRQHNRGLSEKPFFGDFVTLSQFFYRETEKLKTTQQILKYWNNSCWILNKTQTQSSSQWNNQTTKCKIAR